MQLNIGCSQRHRVRHGRWRNQESFIAQVDVLDHPGNVVAEPVLYDQTAHAQCEFAQLQF